MLAMRTCSCVQMEGTLGTVKAAEPASGIWTFNVELSLTRIKSSNLIVNNKNHNNNQKQENPTPD